MRRLDERIDEGPFQHKTRISPFIVSIFYQRPYEGLSALSYRCLEFFFGVGSPDLCVEMTVATKFPLSCTIQDVIAMFKEFMQ